MIASVAVPVKKSLQLRIVAEERIEYFLRCQRGSHRQIAAGQSLGDAEEIRLHAFIVTREEAISSAAQAGHHFVGDELGSVFTRNLRDAAKPSLRLHDHPGRSLHPRLNQQRGVVAPAFFCVM